MKMNKKLLSTLIIFALLLVVFVVLVTAIPFEKNNSSWVSFVFGIVSIITSCVVTMYAFSKGNSIKSKLYGFPIFKVGAIYLLAQMLVCIVMFILGAYLDVPAWISVILGIVLAALCFVGVLLTDNAVDVIEKIDAKTEEQIKVMKTFTVSVECVKAVCTNKELYPALEKLEEAFRYSDPVSSEATQAIEETIQNEIISLTDIVRDNGENAVEKIKEIEGLLTSRNAICKRSK